MDAMIHIVVTGKKSSSYHLQNDRSLLPEFFQPVEFSFLCREEVKHHAPVVQQHPAGWGIPLCSKGAYFLRTQLIVDCVENGQGLAFRYCRTDDEVVGQKGDRAKIE